MTLLKQTAKNTQCNNNNEMKETQPVGLNGELFGFLKTSPTFFRHNLNTTRNIHSHACQHDKQNKKGRMMLAIPEDKKFRILSSISVHVLVQH
jgi:hypothetical protein